MPRQTPNPNPRITLLIIACLAIFLTVGVGWMAVSNGNQGFFHFTASGGVLPASFVLIAIIIGVGSVVLFVHRGQK